MTTLISQTVLRSTVSSLRADSLCVTYCALVSRLSLNDSRGTRMKKETSYSGLQRCQVRCQRERKQER